MVQFYSDKTKIKNSNLVFIAKDLSALKDIGLTPKQMEKVKESQKEKKSFFLSFFVDTPHFEHIYIAFHHPSDTKLACEFLAEHIVKLPSTLTLSSDTPELLRDLLDTTLLARYKFQRYKSEKKHDTISLICAKKDISLFEERIETIKNIIFARELWETPTHDLTPEKFAKIAKDIKFKNTKVKVFWPKDIDKMKMWLLKAVGWGSHHKPYFVVLERIVSKKAPTIGFIGKGIVFDTGGLNLKMPSPIWGMELMKFDMAWAAAVLATMKNLDRKNLKVNIIAAIPLAENSVGGESMRPSDILTAYNGKTVQILNTDAEGRLVLADALSYLSKHYSIDRFMTIATLTGMCLMTFGQRYAAIMGDDREMLEKLKEYSKTHFEKYWELPFDDYYIEKTKSQIADYDNISPGAFAGTIMGGAFVYNFVEKGQKFTHIDIASVADSKAHGLYAKWVTGFGVDSLSDIFQSLS